MPVCRSWECRVTTWHVTPSFPWLGAATGRRRAWLGGRAMSDELLIWASDGVWYQYRDPDTRRMKSSFLGFCDSYEGVNQFAETHRIALEIFPAETCAGAKRPAVRAAGAQKQGR